MSRWLAVHAQTDSPGSDQAPVNEVSERADGLARASGMLARRADSSPAASSAHVPDRPPRRGASITALRVNPRVDLVHRLPPSRW